MQGDNMQSAGSGSNVFLKIYEKKNNAFSKVIF